MVIDMNYWTKVIKRLLAVFFTALFVILGFKLCIFYMPFLIAFILSLLIEPIIRYLMKKLKWKRRTSSIFVFVIVIGIVLGLGTWGVYTLISEASNFLQGFNEYFKKADNLIQSTLESLKIDQIMEKLPVQIRNIIENSSQDFINNTSLFVKDILNKIVNTITQIPTIGFYIVITFLSLYFICCDKIYIIDQLEHHLTEKWMKKLTKHIRQIVKSLGAYLKAQAILIVISFAISLIGFYIFKLFNINIQYPLLIALGICFVDALPIFGSGTVMLPWAVISGLNGDFKLGICIIILWAIMSVVRQLLEPKIVSGKIGIHPIFTLISMYTGFKFIGVLGMIIGPILLIIIKNIFGSVLDRGVMKAILDRT